MGKHGATEPTSPVTWLLPAAGGDDHSSPTALHDAEVDRAEMMDSKILHNLAESEKWYSEPIKLAFVCKHAIAGMKRTFS